MATDDPTAVDPTLDPTLQSIKIAFKSTDPTDELLAKAVQSTNMYKVKAGLILHGKAHIDLDEGMKLFNLLCNHVTKEVKIQAITECRFHNEEAFHLIEKYRDTPLGLLQVYDYFSCNDADYYLLYCDIRNPKR